MTNPAPYCGDPAMALGLMLRRNSAGGVLPLFAGRRVGYSFNTRVAIRKACDLLGLTPGDEVLAPAYNCGSELDPLRHAGLHVRLYPVTEGAEVEPEQVARLIGPRTRALYLTHYFGFLQPATAALRALCDDRGLRLIEDCALSLLSGATPSECRTGDVSVFCFYKFFPVLAGGALVVNDPRIEQDVVFAGTAPAKMIAKRLVRAGLGSALGPWAAARLMQRLKGQGSLQRALPVPGTCPDMPSHYYFDPALQEARITSFTARALSGFDVAAAIAARRANYARLLYALADIPGLVPLYPALVPGSVPLSMPVRVRGATRNWLVAALQAEGITATPWWSGYNRHLDFSDSPEADLSAARGLKDTVLSLPSHQYLGPAEIDHIAARLGDISRHISRSST